MKHRCSLCGEPREPTVVHRCTEAGKVRDQLCRECRRDTVHHCLIQDCVVHHIEQFYSHGTHQELLGVELICKHCGQGWHLGTKTGDPAKANTISEKKPCSEKS